MIRSFALFSLFGNLLSLMWISSLLIEAQEAIEDEQAWTRRIFKHPVLFKPEKTVHLSRSEYRLFVDYRLEQVGKDLYYTWRNAETFFLEVCSQHSGGVRRRIDSVSKMLVSSHFSPSAKVSAELLNYMNKRCVGIKNQVSLAKKLWLTFREGVDAFDGHYIAESSTVELEDDVPKDIYGGMERKKRYGRRKYTHYNGGLRAAMEWFGTIAQKIEAMKANKTSVKRPLQGNKNSKGGVSNFVKDRRNVFTTKRPKRFLWSLINSIGIGVSYSALEADIKKLYENINVLRRNQDLLDAKIMHVAKYVDMTMHVLNETIQRVDSNTRMIERLASLGAVADIERGSMIWLSSVWREIATQSDKINVAIQTNQRNLEMVNELLRMLATNKLTPVVFPPTMMRAKLRFVEEDLLKKSKRLVLPGDYNLNVWMFYQLISVIPIVMQDSILLVLTIPLQDTGLALDL